MPSKSTAQSAHSKSIPRPRYLVEGYDDLTEEEPVRSGTTSLLSGVSAMAKLYEEDGLSVIVWDNLEHKFLERSQIFQNPEG